MSYRQLFLDNRFKTSGTHGDFQIELPDVVATSRVAAVYLANSNFANLFGRVINTNNLLYLIYRPSGQ